MRLGYLLAFAVAVLSYSYGVESHAQRLFPIEPLGVVKRFFFPDRGMPTPINEVLNDPTGRKEIDCRKISSDAAILLIMGQSNAANSGDSLYKPVHSVFNYDWMNGKCYRAEDPLLGTDGDGGTIWSRLGDELIEHAGFKQVLLVDVAASGTSIRVWAGENGPAARAVKAAQALRRYGLKFTHVLWHQGESDWEMHKLVYTRLFSEMTNYIRANGIDAPIFVATSTLCKGRRAPQIREAQRELPMLVPNVFPGADADSVDRFRDRQTDFCHFKASGLAQLATLWRQAIVHHQAVIAATVRPREG